MMNLISIALIVLGGLLIAGISLPKIHAIKHFRQFASTLDRKKTDVTTAREYVYRINGTRKENFATRSFREAEDVYSAIGETGGYQRILQIALLCGIGGFFAGGLIIGNWLLGIVLGIGLYFSPLWVSQFSLYCYEHGDKENL